LDTGTFKTAAGVGWGEVPPIRGREERSRSQLWRQVAHTSDVLKRVIGQRYAGGWRQRDIE
jgi:hypothetical protein